MNLLVTGAWQGAKEHLDTLEQMGHAVAFLQQEKDALPCDPAWVEGVICNGLFLHHELENFPNLRYIQLTSAGFDRVPMDAVRARSIEIHNARGVYSIPMAEAAVGGVLALYRKAAFFARSQQNRCWEKRRDLRELAGKTVVILGCGSVGTACARRFRAFDCRVVGVNRSVRQMPDYDEMHPLTEWDKVLPQADILVLTLPLTAETRGLMDAQRLARMQPGAVLVNIARGALVDADALDRALETHLGGAVLDVFDPEPLPETSHLWARENVLITPHNSFVGEGNAPRLNAVILKNLEGTRHE